MAAQELMATPPAITIQVKQFEETIGIKLMFREENSSIRDVIFEYRQRFKVAPTILMESGSIGLIKQLVRQDNRVGFLERYAVEDD